MKIDQIQHLQQILRVRSSNGAKGAAFDDILNEAAGKAAPAREPGRVNPEAGWLERGERLLDALDDYRRQLADGRTPLKALYPAVQRVEDAAARFETGPAQDAAPELAGIIEEARITAQVALMKYHRGDLL